MALSRDRSGPDWRRVQGALTGFEQQSSKQERNDANSKVDGDRTTAWLKYASLKDRSHPLWSPLPSLTHEGPWCRDMQSRPDISWSSGVTAVMQWASALGQWKRHPETKRRIMVAGSGATFFDEGPPDATQPLWQVRALDFQGMGKSSAMGQEPAHTIRPASCRCRPIAVSFHRLFLGGLLPSRARFRFAGYAHGIRGIVSRQAHASRRKNSRTERSPLDSAHISRGGERRGKDRT
jgi:hypothetical protein